MPPPPPSTDAAPVADPLMTALPLPVSRTAPPFKLAENTDLLTLTVAPPACSTKNAVSATTSAPPASRIEPATMPPEETTFVPPPLTVVLLTVPSTTTVMPPEAVKPVEFMPPRDDFGSTGLDGGTTNSAPSQNDRSAAADDGADRGSAGGDHLRPTATERS
jgi:hypothetical protein